MLLSNNFSLLELTKSQTAERKGIDNKPTAEHIENMVSLCKNILQPIRDQYGSLLYQVVIVVLSCVLLLVAVKTVNMQKVRQQTLR